MHRSVALALLPALLVLPGCVRKYNESSNVAHVESQQKIKKTGPWNFDYITPTGRRVFEEAVAWIDEQDDYGRNPDSPYPKKAMCAVNVSKVFENSRLSNYYSQLVPDLIDIVEDSGGKVIRMQTHSMDEFIRRVNSELGGRIPVGAMIAGCKTRTCSGESGDGHISILGDVDANGYTQVYHNNWYRPENEGGARKPYMISDAHLASGCPRQWMPTPWLKFTRDGSGKIASVSSAYREYLHGLDDLDFFGRTNEGESQKYYGFIAIPYEIWKEAKSGQGSSSSVTPGPIECPSGYTLKQVGEGKMCGDGTNAWGPFTEAMKAKCMQWGGGAVACNSDRWGWDMAKNSRGTSVCPVGATLDPVTTYCVEGANAFGPFPAALITKCEAQNGGSACKTARWGRDFLKWIMGR